MKGYVKLALALAFIFPAAACTSGSCPGKTYGKLDIKDGEFLHYVISSSGEKTLDEYLVTRIENSPAGPNYRIYENLLSVKSGRRLPSDYRSWPVKMLIDAVHARTLDTEGNLEGSELEDFASTGVKGIAYWHYQYFPEISTARYLSRSVTNGVISTRTSTLHVKSIYPSTDAFTKNFIAYRMVVPDNRGIIYWVLPFFIKDPLPVTLRVIKKDRIQVGAGTFRVNKIDTSLSDPFLGKLIGGMLKDADWQVEDSDRRLPVKAGGMGMDIELQEISNVL